MSIKITTRSSQGLRAQASGGQTVLDVFQTVEHYLRRTLSAAHANLLAEPNASGFGGEVDWYTPIENAGPAVPLSAVPEPRRSALLARLASLVGDIQGHAAELKKSAKQSDRLLGQLLLLAIEVPGEDFIYSIGDQPVLIFWGHLRDVAAPDSGVIDRMIARLARPAEPPSTAAAHAPAAPAAALAATPPPAPSLAPRERYFWLVPALWVVFAALSHVIGLELLSACGIGSPFSGASGRLWLDYCPMPSNPNNAELADLEAQNAQLQSQLDRLLGNVAARRQQCGAGAPRVVVPPAPPPAPVAEAPPAPKPPSDSIPIPDDLDKCQGADCLKFLKGCWFADTHLLPQLPDGRKDNAHAEPARQMWCFDEQGRGSFTLKSKSGVACRGTVTASIQNPGAHLNVNQSGSDQCNNGKTFIGDNFSCQKNEEGTICSATGNDPYEIDLHRGKDSPPP